MQDQVGSVLQRIGNVLLVRFGNVSIRNSCRADVTALCGMTFPA